MSLNPDVTSVTSFTILNSGLDDLSSSTLRYRYRPVASSKKSRFLRLLHYIVFKVRLPPWLFVSRDSLYILTNLSPFVNAFYKKSLTFLSDFLDIGFFACFTEHLHIRGLRVIIMLICFTEALDVRTACGGI